MFGTPTIADQTEGITEIALYHETTGPAEISPVGGPSYTPTYRLTLRSDGCAFFSGGSTYLSPGSYISSSLTHDDFVKLAQNVTSLGFFGLFPSYPRDNSIIVDADVVTISVRRNDETSTVTTPLYDGSPKAIDLLWRRIDDSGAGLVWVNDKTSHLVSGAGISNEAAYAKRVLAKCHQ